MSNSTRPGSRSYRGKTDTISQVGDECMLMVDPDNDTRFACVEAAVDSECRPIAAKRETAVEVAAENRPLVIVVGPDVELPGVELTDLAVAVGAQLVRARASERPQDLAKRVGLAITAAKRMRQPGR